MLLHSDFGNICDTDLQESPLRLSKEVKPRSLARPKAVLRARRAPPSLYSLRDTSAPLMTSFTTPPKNPPTPRRNRTSVSLNDLTHEAGIGSREIIEAPKDFLACAHRTATALGPIINYRLPFVAEPAAPRLPGVVAGRYSAGIPA
jgi:hypothetical protein